MAVTAKVRIKSKLGKTEVPEEVRVQFEMLRRQLELYRADARKFTADVFIAPDLRSTLEEALDEEVVAGLQHDSFGAALAILRKAGRYTSHAEQSRGTAYAELANGMYTARERVLKAQHDLIGACENLSKYLMQKCCDDALDTLRERPFTNAIVVALEESWGHIIPDDEVWSSEDRREMITNAAIALSVLRKIAKEEKHEDTPERRARRENARVGTAR